MADDQLEIEIPIVIDQAQAANEFAKTQATAAKAGKSAGSVFSSGMASSFGEISLLLTGFNQGLQLVERGIGLVGEAFHSAFDLIKEGEQIATINRQFEILTQNAGIAGDALRNGLIKASEGLVDDEELIQSANKALVEMGASAKQLPQLLELARKASSISGQSLVETFETINLAIESGNTRGLKSYGIVIDAARAQQAYARQLGVTTDVLSKAGEQHAILNAVLEKGQQALGKVEPAKEASDAYTRFKVAVQEAKEEVAKFTSSALSKPAAGFFDMLTNGMKNFKLNPLAGDPTFDKEVMQKRINDSMAGIKIDKANDPFAKMQITDTRTGKVVQEGSTPDKTKDVESAKWKIKLDQANIGLANYNNAILASDEALANQMVEGQDKIDALDFFAEQRKLAIAQDTQLKLQLLRDSEAQNATMSAQQLEDAKIAIMQESASKQAAIQTASAKKQTDTQNQLNAAVTNGLVNVTSKAISGFASALVKGGDAFKNFGSTMIQTLGQLAINIGEILLTSGIGMLALKMLEPASAIIAGIGLIAIGGVLSGLGGDTGSSSAGVASSSSASGSDNLSNTLADPPKQTNVVVNIQGNVLDRRETGMYILDVLNEQFSANDGKLVVAS